MQKMEGKMPEFVVTIEAESAPQIVLGQSIFGGIVTALKLEKRKLVSGAELVAKYGYSDENHSYQMCSNQPRQQWQVYV